MISNQLIYDLSNKEYHGGEGIYSSSQMKAMIEDPEVFYKKYISKELEQKRIAAFDVGTYFHTAILEPHKLEEECAVFTGGIRRGKEWDAFMAEHGHKAIITQAEYESAQRMIEAVKASPICMGVLKGAKSEVSASIVIYVYSNAVFTIRENKLYRLFLGGWKLDATDIEEVLEWGVRIQIKARADSINVERGIISDLKSTTGNVKSVHEVKTTVANYDYDLSAAFYMDIFTMCAERIMESFIWIFASKDAGVAKAYQASEESIKVGRAKWRKAAIDLAFYINRDWKFSDSLGEIGPVLYNREWLNGE